MIFDIAIRGKNTKHKIILLGFKAKMTYLNDDPVPTKWYFFNIKVDTGKQKHTQAGMGNRNITLHGLT